MKKHELIRVKKMNTNLFKLYMMFVRQPAAKYFIQELEYYSNEDNTIIGTIAFDLTDGDFNCVILCQDEVEVFRAIDMQVSFPSIDSAREWMFRSIRTWTSKGTKIVPQGGVFRGIDIFSLIISKEKIHPAFDKLSTHPAFAAAKRVISEICRFFDDIDGNFVEQFQSINGFDSRLWEIYLFCYFTEENFIFDRNYDRPDFLIQKSNTEIAIEAVTIGRRKDIPAKLRKNPPLKSEEDIREENLNDMPLRYGSALFSKLGKEYWKLPHVKGKGLILAIADFHDEMSMTWSFNAIIDYLYGLKYKAHYDKNGKLVITSEKISPYTKENGTEIEAGFFDLPNTENISAVLFSPMATISKFTRMGIQAGFRFKGQKVIRSGAYYKDDPNAATPNLFSYEVTEECSESWAEGLNMFHNPDAKIPIDKSLFPNIAHHELIDGLINSSIPGFHPYFSINHNMMPFSSITHK